MRYVWILLVLALPAHAQLQPLEPEKAFRPSARYVDAATVEVRYDIEPGYYLYRDKFAFSARPASLKLGKPRLPQGQWHQDEIFGRVETYRHGVAIRFTVPKNETLMLDATSQGCADIGLCYPPVTQTLSIRAPAP